MKFKDIAKKIVELKEKDLQLRDELIKNGQLSEGYNEDMAELHNKNAGILNEIIDNIGYPTIDKVGEAGAEAAWLVIQHAIGQPEFMKKCLRLLEQAVNENKATPVNLAYLTDRIAVFEGKSQRFGTQFDWDENGALSPNPFDDLIKVNQRRTSVGLNKLEKQVEIMRKHVKSENQTPPTDFKKRKEAYNKWRKTVGWIS